MKTLALLLLAAATIAVVLSYPVQQELEMEQLLATAQESRSAQAKAEHMHSMRTFLPQGKAQRILGSHHPRRVPKVEEQNERAIVKEQQAPKWNTSFLNRTTQDFLDKQVARLRDFRNRQVARMRDYLEHQRNTSVEFVRREINETEDYMRREWNNTQAYTRQVLSKQLNKQEKVKEEHFSRPVFGYPQTAHEAADVEREVAQEEWWEWNVQTTAAPWDNWGQGWKETGAEKEGWEEYLFPDEEAEAEQGGKEGAPPSTFLREATSVFIPTAWEKKAKEVAKIQGFLRKIAPLILRKLQG